MSYFSILKSGCIAHIIPPGISDFNLKEQIKETITKTINEIIENFEPEKESENS